MKAKPLLTHILCKDARVPRLIMICDSSSSDSLERVDEECSYSLS
jgi:hypothetical protein